MAFISPLILYYLKKFKAIFMEIDAFDFPLCTILPQIDTNYKLHLIDFYLRKFFARKIN